MVREYKEMKLTFDLYKRKFLPLPPYQFSIEVVRLLHDRNIHTYAWPHFELFEEIFKFTTSPDINDTLRMIEIEEDLIPLIENTDNKIFYRPLFFPTVFINNEFEYDDKIIKGMTILDMSNLPQKLRIEGLENQDYLIMYAIAEKSSSASSGSLFHVGLASLFREILGTVGQEREKTINLLNHIRLIICNIVDMVEGNDEDLELTTIHTSKEQNIKRIQRGQVAFPSKIFIRPKKEFKQYVNDFNQKDKENREKKLMYKLLVRGHWRHFRAERFVRKKGEKTWIKPFYKGQGIVVAKEYKLKK